MAALEGHLFCSACGEICTVTEDCTSGCCLEPIQNELGAGLTVEMILAYLDEDDKYYAEEHGRSKR